MKETQVLILTAGKVPEELECLFGSIPSGLIPLNGKPVLFWLIDKLINEKFRKIGITVGFEKEKIIDLTRRYYNSKIDLNFIEVDHKKPPGNAILEAIDYLSGDNLLIVLGDTLVDKNFSELIKNGESFVLSSKNFTESKKWCLIKEKDGYVNFIYDKKEVENLNELYALVGVYFFNNLERVKKILNYFDCSKSIEISEIIEEYKKFEPIRSIICEEWYDVGHLNNFYKTKKKFLQKRFFNYLEIDDLLGILTKRSENSKLIDEINWYLNLPKELSVLAPRIIEYNISKNTFIKMEYIGYPPLSELWIYGNLNTKIWENILERLLSILLLFRKYRANVSKKDYEYMYITKTEERITSLLNSNELFKKLFQQENIIINSVEYKNWFSIRSEIYKKVKKLYNEEDNCFIHGDLCFSNIFFDVNNGIFKFIDPRGRWGSSCFGDIKYDVAKLRHSIVGNYDFIVNNLYSLSLVDNKITLNIFNEEKHIKIGKYFDKLIEEYWDLNQIKLIEGLLFISMLPLHQDDEKRQLCLYSTGIRRLNEVLNE